MDIRAAIRAEQAWHNWSDSELADRAGIVQSTFSRRMSGKEFRLDEIEKIATAFEITVADLIGAAEKKSFIKN